MCDHILPNMSSPIEEVISGQEELPQAAEFSSIQQPIQQPIQQTQENLTEIRTKIHTLESLLGILRFVKGLDVSADDAQGGANNADDAQEGANRENIMETLKSTLSALQGNVDDFEKISKRLTHDMESIKFDLLEIKQQLNNQAKALYNQGKVLYSPIKLNTNCDGNLTWVVKNLSYHQHVAIDSQRLNREEPFLCSSIFLTHVNGYTLRCKFFANGIALGRGTHLSLYIAILRGPYDVLLKWPFSYEVTFRLRDLSGSNCHVLHTFVADQRLPSFQQPTSFENIPYGCPLFFPLHEFHMFKHLYVSDDTIVFDINVGPPRQKSLLSQRSIPKHRYIPYNVGYRGQKFKST